MPGISRAEMGIIIPSPPQIAASSYILEDFDSGQVIAQKKSDQKVPPASLTKIMTTYVAFNEIENGHIDLDDLVTVSEKAWRTPGSRMFIEVNKQVKIEELLKGVIIQSGNDASVSLAEHIAGDELAFADLMNHYAQQLGMEDSHFVNSTGLPDPEHYTTAKDLILLTREVIKKYPDFYELYAEKEYTFNGIKQPNRNRLLWRDPSVDGLKTGHTEEAGYCLVASAKREQMRLISIVMGANSDEARASESQSLLNYGFRFYKTYRLYEGKQSLTKTQIWKGETEELDLGLEEDLYVTIPRRHYKDLKANINIDKEIHAPVAAGQVFGSVNVKLADEELMEKPLVAMSAVARGGFMKRMFDRVLLLFN